MFLSIDSHKIDLIERALLHDLELAQKSGHSTAELEEVLDDLNRPYTGPKTISKKKPK